MPTQKSNTKVVTGIVRLSYANVWEPAGPVQDGLDGLVHDLGRGGAVGVDEVGTLVRLIVPLGIAVPEGQLQSAFGPQWPYLCH